jgi:signal recognition particle subunit SRP54
LEDPEIIEASRINRISKGAGISVSDIRDLIKQYKQSKKLVKMFKNEKDMNKMMKKFSGKLPGM